MRVFIAATFGFFFFVCSQVFGQNPDPVRLQGRVVDAFNNQPIANAQVVSYGLVQAFATDTLGFFRIELSAQDSIRATAIGYYPKNLKVSDRVADADTIPIRLKPKSYALREVTVKGYRGLLDPFLFPKHEDTSPKINLNLPSWIGSQTNQVSPSERELMPSPSFVQAASSPVSFVYSKLSRREKTMRKLRKVKATQTTRDAWNEVLADSVIGQWVPLEEEELDSFIIYCNQNISVSGRDTGLTLYRKVMDLWETFKNL